MSMMQLTEEQRKELLAEIDYNRKNCFLSDKTELIMQIAEAALTAKPDHYIFKHPNGKLFNVLVSESCKEYENVIAGYTAPPVVAPAIDLLEIVPDEKDRNMIAHVYLDETTADKPDAYVRGFNACRAAIMRKIEEMK